MTKVIGTPTTFLKNSERIISARVLIIRSAAKSSLVQVNLPYKKAKELRNAYQASHSIPCGFHTTRVLFDADREFSSDVFNAFVSEFIKTFIAVAGPGNHVFKVDDSPYVPYLVDDNEKFEALVRLTECGEVA